MIETWARMELLALVYTTVLSVFSREFKGYHAGFQAVL